MKIEGPNRTNAPGKTDKAKKSGSTGGTSFSEYLASEEVETTAPAVGVAGVNLFMALQASEHATEQEQRRRAIRHADDLLNELEDLRVGLLLGTYTKTQLHNLAARIAQQKLVISDPALTALLDEVELRAAVELAKYE